VNNGQAVKQLKEIPEECDARPRLSGHDSKTKSINIPLQKDCKAIYNEFSIYPLKE